MFAIEIVIYCRRADKFASLDSSLRSNSVFA